MINTQKSSLSEETIIQLLRHKDVVYTMIELMYNSTVQVIQHNAIIVLTSILPLLNQEQIIEVLSKYDLMLKLSQQLVSLHNITTTNDVPLIVKKLVDVVKCLHILRDKMGSTFQLGSVVLPYLVSYSKSTLDIELSTTATVLLSLIG